MDTRLQAMALAFAVGRPPEAEPEKVEWEALLTHLGCHRWSEHPLAWWRRHMLRLINKQSTILHTPAWEESVYVAREQLARARAETVASSRPRQRRRLKRPRRRPSPPSSDDDGVFDDAADEGRASSEGSITDISDTVRARSASAPSRTASHRQPAGDTRTHPSRRVLVAPDHKTGGDAELDAGPPTHSPPPAPRNDAQLEPVGAVGGGDGHWRGSGGGDVDGERVAALTPAPATPPPTAAGGGLDARHEAARATRAASDGDDDFVPPSGPGRCDAAVDPSLIRAPFADGCGAGPRPDEDVPPSAEPPPRPSTAVGDGDASERGGGGGGGERELPPAPPAPPAAAGGSSDATHEAARAITPATDDGGAEVASPGPFGNVASEVPPQARAPSASGRGAYPHPTVASPALGDDHRGDASGGATGPAAPSAADASRGGARDGARASRDDVHGFVAVRSELWRSLEAQWGAAAQYDGELVRQIDRARAAAAAAAPDAPVGTSLADLVAAGAGREIPPWDAARWSSDAATGLMDAVAACDRHETRLVERYCLVQSSTVAACGLLGLTVNPAVVSVGDESVGETARRGMLDLDAASHAFAAAAALTIGRVEEALRLRMIRPPGIRPLRLVTPRARFDPGEGGRPPLPDERSWHGWDRLRGEHAEWRDVALAVARNFASVLAQVGEPLGRGCSRTPPSASRPPCNVPSEWLATAEVRGASATVAFVPDRAVNIREHAGPSLDRDGVFDVDDWLARTGASGPPW